MGRVTDSDLNNDNFSSHINLIILAPHKFYSTLWEDRVSFSQNRKSFTKWQNEPALFFQISLKITAKNWQRKKINSKYISMSMWTYYKMHNSLPCTAYFLLWSLVTCWLKVKLHKWLIHKTTTASWQSYSSIVFYDPVEVYLDVFLFPHSPLLEFLLKKVTTHQQVHVFGQKKLWEVHMVPPFGPHKTHWTPQV